MQDRLRQLVLPLASMCLLASTGCVEDADDKDGLPSGPPDTTPVATRYGALGNSLTAGFINGGLVEGGQVASYPMRIAEQAGWDPPQLPRIASPGIGSTPGQSAIAITASGGLGTMPVPNPLALLRNALLPRPYDNLGVPGATTKDLLAATNSQTSQSGNNPFFDLILRNSALPPGNWTPLDAMAARNPKALTLWIGNNDILGGALGGNPVVGGNITPVPVWEQLFLAVVARIDAMNASYVAVANIPNIVDIPYVTTIPPAFPIGPDTFIPFNAVEDDVRHVLLPFGLLAASNPDTLGSFLAGFGTNELPTHWTLTAEESALITATAQAYNQIIERECELRGWAYVDIYTELGALPKDVFQPNFATVNALFPWFPQFGAGGVSFIHNELAAFSLDGVHPSEIGSALVANAFIRSLNATYDLGIGLVDLAQVENVTGFEDAPGGAPGAPIAAVPGGVSPQARQTLEDLPFLLGLGQ